MSARDHNVTRILDGETLPELVPLDEHWKTARKAMTKRQNEAYERAQAQWFKPLYNTPEPEPEPDRTTARVLVGVLVALGGVTGFFMWLLANYRG